MRCTSLQRADCKWFPPSVPNGKHFKSRSSQEESLILGREEVHLWRGDFVERQKRNEILGEIATNYAGTSLKMYYSGGKPCFENAAIHFSISHTANKIFVVFANFPVGLDVELSNRNVSVDAIARRYFDLSEYNFLAACSEAERRTTFFRMWVRKEAAVKLTGEGLARGLQKVRVDPTQEGWPVYREGEAFFVKEFIPWPEALGVIIARDEFSVTACREF